MTVLILVGKRTRWLILSLVCLFAKCFSFLVVLRHDLTTLSLLFYLCLPGSCHHNDDGLCLVGHNQLDGVYLLLLFSPSFFMCPFHPLLTTSRPFPSISTRLDSNNGPRRLTSHSTYSFRFISR